MRLKETGFFTRVQLTVGGSIPAASVEILWVVSKAVMHPAFNRYQIGSTPIPPTQSILDFRF